MIAGVAVTTAGARTMTAGALTTTVGGTIMIADVAAVTPLRRHVACAPQGLVNWAHCCSRLGITTMPSDRKTQRIIATGFARKSASTGEEATSLVVTMSR